MTETTDKENSIAASATATGRGTSSSCTTTREGWRLVQIFAPGTAAFGAARYYELIFERRMTSGA